jgi:geranylgeranyl diphosphate synthase type I
MNIPTPQQQDASTDIAYFAEQLGRSKARIDAEVDRYWDKKLVEIQQTYGHTSRQSVEALATIMARGGKRIRAALAETAYRMFGGHDERVITGMSLALEMIHAYVLIIDDICDRSSLRRGGPTAHRLLENWHKQAKLHGDPTSFGTNMATLAALIGSHEAMIIIGRLPVDAERRLAALDNLNQLLTVTCHGQFNDLMNEASTTRDKQHIENVLVWKTAYYTFANPLQFGALLAGAPPESLESLMSYSLAAGRAFQISDDILGMFGDKGDTGKDPADDIKEGKRTILIIKALELAPVAEAAFMERQLGNTSLRPADFERCKQIIRSSGALAFAQTELNRSCEEASTKARHGGLPKGDGVRLLCGLADYLQGRKA